MLAAAAAGAKAIVSRLIRIDDWKGLLACVSAHQSLESKATGREAGGTSRIAETVDAASVSAVSNTYILQPDKLISLLSRISQSFELWLALGVLRVSTWVKLVSNTPVNAEATFPQPFNNE